MHGGLNAEAGRSSHRVDLRSPAPALQQHVAHYWIVTWDLRDEEPYRQGVLTNPSVHVIFERGCSRVVGLIRGRFTRVVEGSGRLLGVRFRPGCFRPFLGFPVSEITDRVLALEEVFGAASRPVADAVLSAVDEDEMVAAVDRFLLALAPESPPTVQTVAGIVEQIADDPLLTRVDDLARRVGTSQRSLQRLFAEHVGVGPKWVIQRCRLHDAVHRAGAGDVDWTRIALELGYADQAHLIRDFTATTGTSPAKYAKYCRSAALEEALRRPG